MIIRHTQESGVAREFEVKHVDPIGYEGFRDYVAGGRRAFDVRMLGIVRSAPDLPKGSEIEINQTIEFDQKVRHYALVPGGVLPPDLLSPGTGLLFDRNVISDLRRCGDLRTAGLEWLVAGKHVVNPILGAFEGGQRRVQTLDEFLSEFDDNRQVLAQRLPDARCIEFNQTNLAKMHEQQLEFAKRAENESTLLRTMAPWFADPIPGNALLETEGRLLGAIDDAGVRRLTAIVMVLLAKLYEGNTSRPATRLLKLHQVGAQTEESSAVAYNALADIRQLELLATASNMRHNFAAITRDKALALVWGGLRPFSEKGPGDQVHFCFGPHPAMFPRLSGSVVDMVERVLG